MPTKHTMQLRSKRKLGADVSEPPAAKRKRSRQVAPIRKSSCATGSAITTPAESPPRRTSARLRRKYAINDGQSGILALPAELRNYIYELVLLRRPIAMIIMNETSQDRREPSLLQTCVQIRQECAPIYYKSNHFNLDTYGLNLHLKLTWTCDPMVHATIWTPTLHVGKYSDFDLHISIGTAEENLAVRNARTRIKAFVDDGRTAFDRKKLARLMCVLHQYGKMAYERDMRLLARLRSSLAALRSRAEEMQALLSTSATTGAPHSNAGTSADANGVQVARSADAALNATSTDALVHVQAVLERG